MHENNSFKINQKNTCKRDFENQCNLCWKIITEIASFINSERDTYPIENFENKNTSIIYESYFFTAILYGTFIN